MEARTFDQNEYEPEQPSPFWCIFCSLAEKMTYHYFDGSINTFELNDDEEHDAEEMLNAYEELSNDKGRLNSIRIWANVLSVFVYWILMMGLLEAPLVATKVNLAKALLARFGFKTSAFIFGSFFGTIVHLLLYGIAWVAVKPPVGIVLIGFAGALSGIMLFI